jgi:hypothetical protein
VTRILFTLFAAALAYGSLSSHASSQESAGKKLNDRIEGWRTELDSVVDCLKRKHWNAFFKLKREDFEKSVAELREKIPRLKDHEVLVEFMKLVALVGDGHTLVYEIGPKNAFRRYPLEFVWTRDGLFIDAAAKEHEALLRGQVLGIGKADLKEVLRRISAVQAAENESWRKDMALGHLNRAELLAALDIVDDMEKSPFTLLDSSGKKRQVLLAPLTPGAKTEWVRAFDPAAKGVSASRRNPREAYGLQWQEDTRTLYCWYDRCRDVPKRPVSAWCKEVLQQVDAKPVSRVIVDLRRNGGGNSALAEPLIEGLRSRDKVNEEGKLFVLIGRRTFSSAADNAIQFRQRTRAVLIGLPTGGSPNCPGECKYLDLPYSGWEVQYSTKYFRLTENGMRTISPVDYALWQLAIGLGRSKPADSTILPDIVVEPTSMDYFAGQDPVLAAAIKYENPKSK